MAFTYSLAAIRCEFSTRCSLVTASAKLHGNNLLTRTTEMSFPWHWRQGAWHAGGQQPFVHRSLALKARWQERLRCRACCSTSTRSLHVAGTDDLMQTRISRFLDWLKTLDHDPMNLQLVYQPRKSTGRGSSGLAGSPPSVPSDHPPTPLATGLTAHRIGTVAGPGGVKEGDCVVAVPLAALMTPQTAAGCPVVGPLVCAHRLSSWRSLLLHLLWERRQGEGSRWAPYLALLPVEEELRAEHPLLWEETTVTQWLPGSLLIASLASRRQTCRNDCQFLISLGVNDLPLPLSTPPASSSPPSAQGVSPSSSPPSSPLVTEDSVRWAAAVLLSRAFALDLGLLEAGEPSLSLCLVPWADLLNHSSQATGIACLAFNPETQCAELCAHRDYAEGKEVMDSYGPWLTPRELFLDYGFVDDANNTDVAEVEASLLGPTPPPDTAALLEAAGLPYASSRLPFTPSGVDDTSLAFTRALLAPPSLLLSLGWGPQEGAAWRGGERSWRLQSRAARVMGALAADAELMREEVLSLLLSVAACQLSSCPPSLEEDQDLLSRLLEEEDEILLHCELSTGGAVAAVRVRMSEKRALEGAIAALGREMTQLRGTAGDDEVDKG